MSGASVAERGIRAVPDPARGAPDPVTGVPDGGTDVEAEVRLYTVAEVAALLRTSPKTVTRLVRDEGLPVIKLAGWSSRESRQEWRIPHTGLAAWQRARTVVGA